MLDFADVVAINKFDRRGAEDALRDVRQQVRRNREAFGTQPEEMPVFGTIAARFNDDGVTALYQHLRSAARRARPEARRRRAAAVPTAHASTGARPGRAAAARVRYLAEIADAVRGYHARRPRRRRQRRARDASS